MNDTQKLERVRIAALRRGLAWVSARRKALAELGPCPFVVGDRVETTAEADAFGVTRSKGSVIECWPQEKTDGIYDTGFIGYSGWGVYILDENTKEQLGFTVAWLQKASTVDMVA